MQIAVYPGSFDPITNGHINVVERLSQMFTKVIVLIARSNEKQELFTTAERKKQIEASLSHLKNIEVDVHEGLTYQYVQKRGAKIIVRGLRAVVDFEFESSLATMNSKLAPEIETLFIFAKPEYYFISSRGVKEVARHKGPLKDLVPSLVAKQLEEKYK